MTGREFTALQFAVACGLRPDRAREFLEAFEQSGVVERNGIKWVATPHGLALSRSLGADDVRRTAV